MQSWHAEAPGLIPTWHDPCAPQGGPVASSTAAFKQHQVKYCRREPKNALEGPES